MDDERRGARDDEEAPDGELGDDVRAPLPTGTAGQGGAEEAPPSGEEGSKDDEDVDRDPLDEALEESFPASDPPSSY